MASTSRSRRAARAVQGSGLFVVLHAGAAAGRVAGVVEAADAEFRLVFSRSRERLQHEARQCEAELGVTVPDLTRYHRVHGPRGRFARLVERLAVLEEVEGAYMAPPVEVPECLSLRDMKPRRAAPRVPTPDLSARQRYLGPAPEGIDARAAWQHPGGGGADVGIIDIEGGWCFTHEDLLRNGGGLIAGTSSRRRAYRNHGTAVVGMLGADRNGFGVTGICPEAGVRAVAVVAVDDPEAPARAIRRAAHALRAGDIILVEIHSPGPRVAFEPNEKGEGYIAVEWWPHNLAAIRYATSRGVLVVEAGGNGSENLDDPLYDQGDLGFPKSWRNPFRRRGHHDSGAIVIGAGAPPPGTHGEDCGPDRSRLDFSNYGALIDAQGWGKMITTCGFGTLQGGSSQNHWYTDHFGGTSGAAPMVAGALACVQGILRAEGRAPLTPARARELLRRTGSKQQPAPHRPVSQRIGRRPDLRQLIAGLS